MQAYQGISHVDLTREQVKVLTKDGWSRETSWSKVHLNWALVTTDEEHFLVWSKTQWPGQMCRMQWRTHGHQGCHSLNGTDTSVWFFETILVIMALGLETSKYVASRVLKSHCLLSLLLGGSVIFVHTAETCMNYLSWMAFLVLVSLSASGATMGKSSTALLGFTFSFREITTSFSDFFCLFVCFWPLFTFVIFHSQLLGEGKSELRTFCEELWTFLPSDSRTYLGDRASGRRGTLWRTPWHIDIFHSGTCRRNSFASGRSDNLHMT